MSITERLTVEHNRRLEETKASLEETLEKLNTAQLNMMFSVNNKDREYYYARIIRLAAKANLLRASYEDLYNAKPFSAV